MEIEKLSTTTKDNSTNLEGVANNKSSRAPDTTKVEVAVRVRPFITKEILTKEQKCVQCFSETSQILMGKDRTFNFDKVFDENTKQEEVYEKCAKDLVISCLSGYNATILAYGQTGSGKTFTMGSNSGYHLNPEEVGIIPRVMKEIFIEIEKRAQKSEFLIRVSFLEIYNEDIQDLLDNSNPRLKFNSSLYNKNPITVREEKDGSISIYGINEEKVTSYEEMMACLERGSLHRATASTLMNETSSRSHAIFTISIEQHEIDDLYPKVSLDKKPKQGDDNGFTTAKFHFVDLAGSERLKRTGASGTVLREGININRGLLALGNVISALTDDTGKVNHVPYRESKLTRMLQDSLGGNSRTVMIACVSPAESNFDESLNTLKYAARTRNIRNKPIINRDPQSTMISQLKQQIFDLQNELLTCKRVIATNLKDGTLPDPQIYSSISSTLTGNIGYLREENNLKEEVKSLKIKLFQHEKELVKVNSELQETKMMLNQSEISLYSVQKERDLLKIIQEKYKKYFEENGLPINFLDDPELIEVDSKDLIEEYSKKVETLKQELKDKEKLNEELQQEYDNLIKSSAKDHELLLEKTKMIQTLTSQLKKQKNLLKQMQGNDMVAELGSGMKLPQMGNDRMDEKGENGFESEEYGDDNEEDILQREFEVNTQAAREEMMLVDGTLLEKEELLENITQNQLILERNLVEEMKNQYYSKILHLEDEIKQLEKKRDESISKMHPNQQENDKNKVIGTYKQKISELETKLKEFKKREKDQQNLLKLVNNQRSKIDQLGAEINKIKAQKTLLHKRMREEAEKFEKIKNTRQKELLEVKKKNLEKDAMINKLKCENQRKDLMYKKKAEELLARYMSKELYKQINRNNNTHASATLQLSSSKKNQKKMFIMNSPFGNKTNSEESIDEVIQESEGRQLVDFCTSQLTEHLKLSYEIEKEEENLKKTEEELENEKNKYSQILLTRDKMEIEKREIVGDLELEQSLTTKIQEHELELNEIYTRIENLEEKLEFQLGKVKSLTEQLSAKPPVDAEQLLVNNNRISRNPSNCQTILRCLFGKHVGSNLEIVKQQEKINNLASNFAELKKKLEASEQRAKFAELQYEINLTKLTKEYEKNQLLLMKQSEDERSGGEDGEATPTRQVDSPSDKELIGQTRLNLSMIDRSGPDMPYSQRSVTNAQYLTERGQNINMLHAARHRRVHSGTEAVSHSRNNSVKMIESPPKKQEKTMTSLELTKKGDKTLLEQNKRLERAVSDMTRKQQNSDKIIETLKRKCEVLQEKYDQFKKQTAKEKFIGFQKGEEANLGNSNTSTSNMGLFNENSLSLAQINPFSLNSESSTRISPFVSTPTPVANQGEGNAAAQSGISKNEKPSMEIINTLNLLSFRDKRREEKQRSKFVRQQTGDPNLSINLNSSGLDTSLGEISLKKKPVGFLTSTNASGPNTIKFSSNGNQGQPARNTARVPSTNKGSSFLDFDEKIYPENNLKDGGKSSNEQNDNDLVIEDYLVSEKENIADKPFDEIPAKSMDYNNKTWKCCFGVDTAHNGGVYAMVSNRSMLYSSGNKTIKVWSLDRMACIGEINAHSSSIKSMTVWPERNLLVTACDKTIGLWDLVSLQNVGTLKGHKDEIRALHVSSNNLLVSAGKGSASYGAVLTWDLRGLSPTDEKEKNQEVFSLASFNGTLYYGSRNHQVRRVNLLTMESLAPFEPPHYDVVTSLTVVKDYLVSGSRDKNLRLWGLDHPTHNLRHTSYAHQDWINVIQSDDPRNILYSGSRDGTIKVWSVINNRKLRCLSDINGHAQSVTSICQIPDLNEAMFVTSSLDRTIKVWKPTDETIETNALKNYHTSPGLKQYKPNTTSKEVSPSNFNPVFSPHMNLEKDKL